MSLSLSSLLNPTPDSETRQSSPPRKDSLPPIQHVQSPTEHPTGSPVSAQSGQHHFAQPSSTTHEAAQVLASLSTSPAPPSQQWSGHTAQDPTQLERQRSWERRQSGYGDPIQLPPPSSGAIARKPSSPTLDQYHVASRSPEQRRPSIVSPTQSHVTLPPLQGFSSSSMEQTRRYSHAQNGDSAQKPHSPEAASHAELQNSSHDLDGVTHFPATELPVPPPQIKTQTLETFDSVEESDALPALIKQETIPTPQPSSPIEPRRPTDMEQQTLKAVTSLKNEHGLRTQSPLRESSVPVPTTEIATPDQQQVMSKKRPAPAKTKKGTASTVKKDKAHPAKRRKVEPKRSATPSSRASKPPTAKGASTKGTPVNSSPAPSNRSYSAEPNEEPYDDDDDDEDMDEDIDDDDLYCICRKPDNGTFMIGCDGKCDDWFHGKCVGIEERDKNLIDRYICPNCTEAGVGRTTFKRMCRRSGCRQPARVGKTRNGNNKSKYCSDECGVTFFRDKVSRTRGREESSKSRASRRKGSFTSLDAPDDDLGARGGALSAGEVKALLDSSNSVEEFKKLGDGVLSPPATPDGKGADKKGPEFTDPEAQALERILVEKEEARRRHALLKDRMKFVTLVKQAASRTAAEKELKSKEYCGYDPRLEWTEACFQLWRNSQVGQQAFEQDTLQTEKSNPKDTEHPQGETEPEVCDRKKCARHLEWSKLAVDDLRFEMSDNGDRMRGLDREETEIKERAALRAKAGNLQGEGSVEVHGLGVSTEPVVAEKMDVDPAPKTNGVVGSVESAVPEAV